ncbi:DUF29 domain-containing protein [Thiocapsa roseopersicina]|uniref:DUF29 domain-containing protein n=1 Tax=Thiocapsa roseopersicina TaxID=1058 RepID=A0A1H2TWB4_THIRO|nr:DUF29 domain-containing protein [Thiocapsa roseopersicina]SDW48296.1 protein of unknown function DUF29 [Thiocapsa roseopersicina]
MSQTLYDRDLYDWSMQTARLLREGRYAEIDTLHLAEEVESMGKSERRALEHRLVVLLVHLLKWEYQPEQRSKSWQRTLIEQRKQVAKLLDDSPSLKPRLTDLLVDAYDSAVRWAADETGKDESEFPQNCPYRSKQVLDPSFSPGPDETDATRRD